MADELRIGIIGAGAIAQTHAQAVNQCPGMTLTTVVDVRPEAGAALADAYGAESFVDYQEVLDQKLADAVIICTPPATHPDIAVEFLANDVSVLCEKPLSIDVDSAQKMVAAARRTEATFTMASKFRFVDDVVITRGIIASGVLGDIVLYENAFTAHVDMKDRWNSNPALSGGGVLIDNGTHSLDIIRYLLGPIAEVQVIEGRRLQNLEVEDSVQVFILNQNGVRGTVDLSWSIDKELDYYISIYGSRGNVRIGWKDSRYRGASQTEWTVFGTGYDKVLSFVKQLENFRNSILGKEKLRITPEDALASVKVVDAVYRSMAMAKWIPVDPVVQ